MCIFVYVNLFYLHKMGKYGFDGKLHSLHILFSNIEFNNKADFCIYSESQNLNIMELKQKNIYDKPKLLKLCKKGIF